MGQAWESWTMWCPHENSMALHLPWEIELGETRNRDLHEVKGFLRLRHDKAGSG